MPLLKGTKRVDDAWGHAESAEDLPPSGPVIVPLSVWEANRDSLRARNTPLGVRLEPGETPERIAEDLDRLEVVALAFPKFTDGRAYSYASLLRERYGYSGELRAVGNVQRDQALFMWRCGFDAFDVDDESEAQAWEAALQRYSVAFQPAARDNAAPAPWRPHARSTANRS